MSLWLLVCSGGLPLGRGSGGKVMVGHLSGRGYGSLRSLKGALDPQPILLVARIKHRVVAIILRRQPMCSSLRT